MIMIFLVILYRLSGIVANIALLVYVMLLLLVLGKGFNATMTLPGIAGIILSMGVAVDANILIFERFKEEVFSGKSDVYKRQVRAQVLERCALTCQSLLW